VEGVFIADGSIFPSAPAANPQAAIMAAASLIARGILDRA
jgi:choline dehydrogenase-like flavoprotein